jgi:hypothetical protein
MYLLLLAFGAVLTAAGIVLAASGVSLHERVFDASIVTPGIVAAVGGLLLVGLGLALRVLQRIERALAARPIQRTAQPGEAAEFSGAAERPSEPNRLPFPSKAAAARLQSAPTAATPGLGAGEKRDSGLPEKLPEKISAMTRIEDTELSLSSASPPPLLSTNVDATVAEVDKTRLIRRRNGSAPTRMAPRLDVSARPPAERPTGPAFDTLWPKGPRPVRAAPSAPAQSATAPVVEPEQKSEPAPEAAQMSIPDEAGEQISVLKSGVVDGMAYTLYSDGSIEAQLPQGTLRFGSITELRNHIEQSA